MANQASSTWTCGANGPDTVKDLRKQLTALAKRKSGKQLISEKFTKDHIFAGHAGDVGKLAAMLSKLRQLPASTLLITSLDAHAQAEVLNWIDNVPDNKLHFNAKTKTWSVDNTGTAVPGAGSYKWATVDLDALHAMNRDDVVKKSRKWLTVSTKTPKVACRFATDGTPLIYHLDY